VIKQYKRLQNGSDVRGVALEGVEGEPVTLSPETAYFVACGFAEWLKKKVNSKSPRVSIGRDPRLSGEATRDAIIAGLVSRGCVAEDIGLATTPACFMSCVSKGFEYDGSIMITASHLPWNRNGMKYFTASGGLKKPDIADIVATAADLSQTGPPVELSAEAPKTDYMPEYAAHLRDIIIKGINHPDHPEKPLTGLHVVVDAGNGSGGFFPSMVLEPLGADTSGSQFLDPDGNFPNHIPNPENQQAMDMATEAVLQNNADLGIVFDTDVDRSAVVDSSGTAINSNRLICLLSAIVLNDHPGTTIVTDSVTSDGVADFIAARGGKHLRFKRGYQNIITKGVELNADGEETHLMIETSGHGAIKANYFLDDGAYLAVKILISLMKARLEGGGSLSSLMDGYEDAADNAEYRLTLTVDEFQSEGARVLQGFKELVDSKVHTDWTMAESNYEGWRVSVDEGDGNRGWVLMRQSLHDPLIVVNIESSQPDGCADIKQKLLSWLEYSTNYNVDYSKLM